MINRSGIHVTITQPITPRPGQILLWSKTKPQNYFIAYHEVQIQKKKKKMKNLADSSSKIQRVQEENVTWLYDQDILDQCFYQTSTTFST